MRPTRTMPQTGLPDSGWLVLTPKKPTLACSWCGRPWSKRAGALLCTTCDQP